MTLVHVKLSVLAAAVVLSAGALVTPVNAAPAKAVTAASAASAAVPAVPATAASAPVTAPSTSSTPLRATGISQPVGIAPTAAAATATTPAIPATLPVITATSTVTPVSAALPASVSSPSTASGLALPSLPLQPATQGSAPVFSAPSFTPTTGPIEEPAFEPGQLLVLWTSDEAAASGLTTLQNRYQQRPRLRYTLASLGFTVVMLALPNDRDATSLLNQLRAEQPEWVVDRNARSVPMQSNPAVSPAAVPVSNTPPAPDALPRLFAQKMLGMSFKTEVRAGSTLVQPTLKVGVVDSGVDNTLAQAAALNGSTVIRRNVLGPADKPAATTHGNAVLQLLAGKSQGNGFAGSAPPMLLHWASAMRELGGKPSTNSLMLVLALDWLLGEQVALINMSLGGQGDAVLKAAVGKLINKNIAIVAAVGNNPAANAPTTYPAAYPGVWAVTAVDAAGKLYAQAHRASYTALAAPGVDLWVPHAAESMINGSSPGSYVSGTSYATALATATLAWQPSAFWSLLPAAQRTQVCEQALKLTVMTHSGCGLVQKAVAP